MKLLGIDYGQKRVGLAISQAGMAFPFKTLIKTSRDTLLAELLDIVRTEQIKAIVLGLPLDLDGQETLTTRQVRNFQASLARRTALPIHTVNEALTSFEAGQRLRQAGISPRKQAAMCDQVAAVCILETFLGDHP